MQEYIAEQKAHLPRKLEKRETLSTDKEGNVIAAGIGACERLNGAPPKKMRRMCRVAKVFADRFSADVAGYVMPPTAKSCAMESLANQLKLISKRSNWKSLVNDRDSSFSTTMAEFSPQTCTNNDRRELAKCFC